MSLTYRSIDIMAWTKDLLNNPKSQAAIDAHITAIAADFPTLTHIGISVPFNTQAEANPDFAIDPAVYTARFTTPIHTAGLKVLWRPTHCTFEGIYSENGFNKTNLLNSVFKANLVDWANTNHTLFATSDLVGCFPEAYAHQNLSDGGQYDDFFIALKSEMEAALASHGKTVNAGMTSQNFTDALQNRNGRIWPIFDNAGISVVDHYGTAIGLNKRFTSFNGIGNSGSATYTCPTAISETNTHKMPFTPEKVAYNSDIDVFVVNPGSGSMTMTIHKNSDNSRAKMVNHTNIATTFDSYTVTIPNNQLVANAYNTFSIDFFNQPDEAYHLHLTSQNGDATVKVHPSHPNDLGGDQAAYPGGWLVCNGYKYNARPEAMEIDIRNLYARTGHQVYLQEWGDYWSLDSSRSSPVRNQAQEEAYLDSMYAALQRLVDENILVGFNYWRACGGAEAIYDSAGTTLNYSGTRLKTFFANNAAAPAAPTAPSVLALSVVSDTAINLSWTDNSTNELGFKIERKTGVGGTYVQIGTTGINVSTYSDTGLTASTNYYYQVRAYNNTGNSSYLTEANATTNAPVSPPQVATPGISPNGGSFANTVSVTLTCATASATIRYTTDGSTPNGSSTVYSAPLSLSAITTIKAIGIRTAYTNSAVVSATFTPFPQPPTPTTALVRKKQRALIATL